jgi:hypothetical protein
MHILNSHGRNTKLGNILVLICLLVTSTNSTTLVDAQTASPSVSAASGCSIIYNGNNGWVLEMCTTDPAVVTPMAVLVDGVSKGNAALVRIYHRSQTGPGAPQVAIIYASGYVRLKQNADPSSSIPFGTSFILGPAYWSDVSTYHHNPQLTQLTVDTTWLPNAPLRMQAEGANHNFDVTYEMTLPPPRDNQTRLHVVQSYTATANININSTKLSEYQGFKLVQASSMFINEGGTCDGGFTDCHDSNDVRFIANDLNRRQVAFKGLTAPSFIFSAPRPLGTTWFDVLHKDDDGWQSQTGAGTSGNTPNVRIALDELPTTHTVTPQGWIDATTDPNDDNVTLWLHDDGASSASWTIGESDQISYWLLAQDNPPDPWEDLGLRSGFTFLNFNGTYDCYPVRDPSQDTTAAVGPWNGYTDRAVRLTYGLGSDNGNWAQVRCDFNPPLDLSTYDHLRFDWQGSSAGNSLEVGLVNPKPGGGENIFARGYHHPTHHSWWGQMVIPFRFLHPWTEGATFDPSKISAFFISVVKDPVDDVGGLGAIAIDNLNAYNVASRTTPGTFEVVDSNSKAAQSAASWLASQQQATGLLKSWEEEGSCVAHTYDQALALIVFASQGMWTEADTLVDGLITTQNLDGSWYKSRNCVTLAQVDSNKWEGDIAWAVFALGKYLKLGGTHGQASLALQDGADWLATRVNPTDGCLVIDHTEGTIDAWWAFQSAGASHSDNALSIKNCLLTYYWDEPMGRFKGGRDWWQPYLDNQTWGAAFLNEIGETEKALRALSYARDVFLVPAQGGQLFGYDGQAGPWSVWNEGTGQYIALGGEGANDRLIEILAQQESDGSVVGSPDEFNGGGVWTTHWHGLAPTAWLYNALCGEPFNFGCNSAKVDVTIGTNLMGRYAVPPGQEKREFYPASGGPVVVESTNTMDIIAAIRLQSMKSGTLLDYNETMGIPEGSLSTKYIFPVYENQWAPLNSQLRFAHLGAGTKTIKVTIGSESWTYDVAEGQDKRIFLDRSGGPVIVESVDGVTKIVAAIRLQAMSNNVLHAYSETFGIPIENLSTRYYFPVYENLWAPLNSQLRFAHLGAGTKTIKVTIGTETWTYDVAEGQDKRISLDRSGGPVIIESLDGVTKVIAAIRLQSMKSGTLLDYNETMGIPEGSLSTKYIFPVYENLWAPLNSQLRFAHLGAGTRTIKVTIGTETWTYDVAEGQDKRIFLDRSGGPVIVESLDGVTQIVAAIRLQCMKDGILNCYSETMGIPFEFLSDTYYFPVYENLWAPLNSQVRFGVP